MARPSEYNDQILVKAREYLDNLPEDEVVHSIEGLADALGITRPTIYDWISQADKEEFSYIVEKVRQSQGKKLVNKGLSGDFNSKIAAVMLSKHGYREGHELTGKDGKDLPTPILANIDTKKDGENEGANP